jgi:hypothetical protein
VPAKPSGRVAAEGSAPANACDPITGSIGRAAEAAAAPLTAGGRVVTASGDRDGSKLAAGGPTPPVAGAVVSAGGPRSRPAAAATGTGTGATGQGASSLPCLEREEASCSVRG